jgi:ABC-type multidrug transport system fused ATPase/permease subunit
LSVIVARLRFSYLLAPAEYFVKLAGRLNEKEETLKEAEIVQGTANDALRDIREKVTRDIDTSIEHAQHAFRLLEPVISYMSVFRNLGVLAFMGALTVSALWVSPYLGLLFMLFCAVAYSYSQLDELFRKAARKNAGFRKIGEILQRRA